MVRGLEPAHRGRMELEWRNVRGSQMRLLDLFCGAGGGSVGYRRAGFTEIVGVDINPQRRYPFEFVRGDALEFVANTGTNLT